MSRPFTPEQEARVHEIVREELAAVVGGEIMPAFTPARMRALDSGVSEGLRAAGRPDQIVGEIRKAALGIKDDPNA